MDLVTRESGNQQQDSTPREGILEGNEGKEGSQKKNSEKTRAGA